MFIEQLFSARHHGELCQYLPKPRGLLQKVLERHFLNLVLMSAYLSVLAICSCFHVLTLRQNSFPSSGRVRSIQKKKGWQSQEQREPTETQAVDETRQAVLSCGLGTLPSNISHCAEEEGKGCPPPKLELLGIIESSTRGPANRDPDESLNCALDIRQLKVES